MVTKNSFVITIGDQGTIITLHKGDLIKKKIFVAKINEALKKELAPIFDQNKFDPVYILLDTIDQIYKKKDYPFIKKHDLKHLIRRDMQADGDKNSLKNYFISENSNNKFKNQKDKKWECLFISASIEKEANAWLEFLLELPNRLIGIYMAPIESFNLFCLLKNNIKSSSKIEKRKNEVYCLILQNKVSGLRQILFNDKGILFTRLISHKIDDKDFIEKYEKDIYSTFEYLKRIIIDIEIKEMEIINILPANILQDISKMKNIDFNFINYTPYQAATTAFNNEAISKNSSFCDLLISKAFTSSKKKILRFSTPKINLHEKLFYGTKISYYSNLLLLLTIGISCLFVIKKINDLQEKKSLAEVQKLSALQILNKTTKDALEDGDSISKNNVDEIDRILDIGKIHETLNKNDIDIKTIYSQFDFITKYKIKASYFDYNTLNFDSKNPSNQPQYKIHLTGDITNKSGDIEDLFTQFDGVTSEFQNSFKEFEADHSELPKNIDFAKKYYNLPIEFNVKKK